MLEKQRKVLQVAIINIPDGQVTFGHEDEESVDGWALHYGMSTDDWEEMGAPDTITVTIEPGDKLNDGEYGTGVESVEAHC